jgi:hypothetical protein
MAGQRKALIVAVGDYDQDALKDLRSAAADAEALTRVLADPQVGDFAVQVVRNQPSYVIQASIEELFSESRPDDVLLLHFSGHGLKSESGELFFAAANTRPNRLGSTAVAAEFVQRCMRDSRSRSVVLLLDCCYGGAFDQGVAVRAAGDVNVLDSFPDVQAGGGRGRAVITASSAMEYAFEGERLTDDQQRRPSVFTAAVVEGLATGDADRDEDGWISLDELYDYVYDKVREQNPHQTPNRQFQLEGELYLARSRRKRVRPAAIPPDLRAAIADPNMFTRLGAVSELRFRLTSGDVSIAVAARQALAEMAHADSRTVAESAAAALAEAAIRPARLALDFGELRPGTTSAPQTVELLGPPIARACEVRPAPDSIHVTRTGDRLEISVTAGPAGPLIGEVGLHGPAGQAVIAITATVVSGASPTVPRAIPNPRDYPTGRAATPPALVPSAPVPAPVAAPVPAADPVAPVRTAAAVTGAVAALLAGALALASYHYLYPAPGVNFIFFERTFSILPMAVAIAALLWPAQRLLTLGLLQGLLWPSVAWLTADIVGAASGSVLLFGFAYKGAQFEALSDALGVVAVIALLRAWAGPVRAWARPGAGGRLPALSVLLVSCATASQLGGAFLFSSPGIQSTATDVQGAVTVIVALGVSWYAVRLRPAAAGSVLVLGWVTTTLIWQIATVAYVSIGLPASAKIGIGIEFPLLIVTAILAALRARGPAGEPPRAGAGYPGLQHGNIPRSPTRKRSLPQESPRSRRIRAQIA